MTHWSSGPFHAARDGLHEIDRVLHLSIQGICQIAASVPLVEALADLDRFRGSESNPSDTERRLEATRGQAEFAQRELDRGFPTLHSHAVIAMWGHLEAFVEDLAVTFLENDPKLLASPLLAAIKIPLAEFELLDRPERLGFLLSEYLRRTKADFKQGVSRFELILDVIGIGGPVDDTVRQALFELSHVRNVLVHRAGVADRRMVSSCPGLGLRAGDKLAVSHDQYTRYLTAIQTYFVELITRALQYRGYAREEAERRVRAAAKGVPSDEGA